MLSTPSNAELATLVRDAQAGDKDALARLLQSESDIIRGVIEGRVREHDVEDVLQEVRLAVWEALPNLNEPGAFTAWLRRITTRTIADHYRNGDGAVPTGLIQDDLQEAETALEEIEGWAVVEELLADLPPRHQLVMVLRGVEELPFSEVGEELGLTEEGARVLFWRAKLKIFAGVKRFDPKTPT